MVHFSIFHITHSLALNLFFPIGALSAHTGQTINLSDLRHLMSGYVTIARDYWPFVLLAVLSSRERFLTVFEAKFRLLTSYANVVQMHSMIFFFILAHWAHIDYFLIYVVVYAVYFFPWHACQHWLQKLKVRT